mgnify:CR=1 FL=1
MKNQIPTLQTASLTLRPLRETDAPVLHRIYQSEGVLRYFPNTSPPVLERVERFIAVQEKHWQDYGYGNWGILPKNASEIIGWAGLQFLPELNETEVGFLLDKPFWGQGFATEAARISLQFGFEHFDFDHIVALAHPENLASQRVLQKCGMLPLETIHIWGIDLIRHQLDRPERQTLS